MIIESVSSLEILDRESNKAYSSMLALPRAFSEQFSKSPIKYRRKANQVRRLGLDYFHPNEQQSASQHCLAARSRTKIEAEILQLFFALLQESRMASDSEAELELIRRVAEGDDMAFQKLLLPHIVYLSDFIAAKYPQLECGVSTVEDVIQETLADAYRQLDKFDPKRGVTLRTWLATIANRRACDAIRAQGRIKRGGKHERVVRQAAVVDSSMHDLVDMLSAGSHTASRSVIRHEAVQAVHDAIKELPEHYRQAVQLHLLNGKTLDEVAAVMNRSPNSVQGLIDRAKRKLVAVLGRLSKYQ